MQNLDLLTRLPTSLSCSILRDWLTLKYVIALDSTYCCKLLRSNYLELLQSDEYFIREQITFSKQSHCINGLRRFGEKLRAIAFDDALTSAQGNFLLEHCHRLTHVRYNRLESCTHESWSLLATNPHIEFLFASLSNTNYANSVVPSWKGIVLPQLRTMSLTGMWVTNQHCLGAMRLSNNITKLDLSHSKIKHSTLLQIPHLCPNLTSVGIAGTKLTDEVLSAITASCTNIVHLDISYNEELTDAGILSMVQNVNRLQSLNIEGVQPLTSTSLKHIYTHCASTLHTLYFDCLSGGPSFESNIICEFFERCQHLQTVHFFVDLGAGTDFGCILPQTNLNSLTTLALSGNFICEDTLCIIGKSCFNLQTLSIDSCHNHSATSLLSICNGCIHLNELCLVVSDTFDDEGERVRMSALEEFALNLWQQIRPGLVISQTPLEARYSVTDM